METRRIGSLNVSVIGLGCNNFGRRLDADRTAAVVGAALDRASRSSIRPTFTEEQRAKNFSAERSGNDAVTSS
jgi:hypothetical protein